MTINFEASDLPRKRECFTAIHNFFLTRPDGTTASERFFRQKPRLDVCTRFWHRWSYRLHLSVHRGDPKVADPMIEAADMVHYLQGFSCLHALMSQVWPTSPPSQPGKGQS